MHNKEELSVVRALTTATKIYVHTSYQRRLIFTSIRTFDGEKELNRGHIDRIKSHEEAMRSVLKILKDQKIDKVGHRVVHGGEKFTKPTKINFLNLRQLEKLSELAPLHNPQT